MKPLVPMVLFAGLLIAVPGFAQTTTTTDPTTGQPTTVQTPAPTPDTDRDLNDLPNEFIVAGFIGDSFSRSALSSNVDFGGLFDYLHNGSFGAEFLAGFAPRFKLDKLGGVNSDLNNYMANVIAAVPVGTFHAVRPFLSAGIGALTISQNNNVSSNPVVSATNALFAPSETHFGGDIGGGIMAFTGSVGIRADIRYFSALGTKGGPVGSLVSTGVNGTNQSLLDKTSFWRANVGFAFRF